MLSSIEVNTFQIEILSILMIISLGYILKVKLQVLKI